MNTKFLLYSVLMALVVIWLDSCRQTDSSEPNLPPLSFRVVATQSAKNADVALTWTRANDPNGDPVTYSVVYKDTIARNLTDTTLIIRNVGYYTTIAGNVIAKDDHGASTVASFMLTVGSQAYTPETVRFVKPDDGRSLKNGLSWSTAYDQTQLQTAINSLSVTGGQVWVAQGIYKPTTDAKDRLASFSMRSRVAIYGGFSADATSLLARNPSRFPTILSGDIDGDGTLANNSYSVMTNKGVSALSTMGYITSLDSTAILDGFTITGGNANAPLGYVSNSGGGIYNSTASPTFINCIITGNTAISSGGGVANYEFARPYFINCLIKTNSAGDGGGMSNYRSAARLINCVIRDNTAQTIGGGLSSTYSAALKLVNCTITGNSAPLGSALSTSTYSGTALFNCILWNNGGAKAIKNNPSPDEQILNETYASDCLIEAETVNYLDINNLKISLSPFVSINSLELLPSSGAIDGGSNETYSQWLGPQIDFTGNARINNQIIDIGAIEYR